jgi:hypothetical protein
VINVIFLTRLAACGNQTNHGSCGNQTNHGSFTIQLLILLTSVATLVYKAMHLRDFPAVWQEHELLLVEKRQLDDRFRVLSNANAQPDAISAEMTEDTPSESGADDAEAVEGEAVAAAVAKPATAVPAQPSQLPAQPSQQLNLRPGEGDARAHPRRAVLEVTTFEIGMLPECGR